MKKMQLFTEVEFSPEEFNEIPRVLHVLSWDGWENYKEQAFSKKIDSEDSKITSQKYYFRRTI